MRSAKKLANPRKLWARFSNLRANFKLDRVVARIFEWPVFWPAGQILTGLNRLLLLSVALAAIGAAGCRSDSPPHSTATASKGAVARGGELLVSVRSEPRSFNRHAARDSTTNLVSKLTQASLIRVNQATQAVEPWLAESWTTAPDGRQVTLRLARDVAFSDGHPFTAADVLFAFEAAYDDRTGSALADVVQAGGKKLQVTATDPHTVVVTFPSPFAPGIRILNDLPILPRHKLEAAVNAGTFRTARGLDPPPALLAGVGPSPRSGHAPGHRAA